MTVATTPATPQAPQKGNPVSTTWPLVGLMVLLLVVAVYQIVRFHGHWAETDTAIQTLAIQTLLESHELVPTFGVIYSHGFLYPVASVALVVYTAVSPIELQTIVYPMLIVLVIPPAYAFFREVTNSAKTAFLSTLLLFVQPDFLFVLLRGSHERFLRTIMLILFFIFFRSIRFRNKPRDFAIHIAVFYLIALALIATNVFFAISLIFAVVIAMVIEWLLGTWKPELRASIFPVAARFVSISISATGIAFVYIFYLYSPSKQSVVAMSGIAERTLNFFFTTSPAGISAAPYYAGGWINPFISILVLAPAALLLIISSYGWGKIAISLVKHSTDQFTLHQLTLWVFFLAFALQGLVAFAAGKGGGPATNLLLRFYPTLVLVAAPIAAEEISRWGATRWRRLACAITLVFLGAIALIKATNEPLFSNKWTFYNDSEVEAMQWVRDFRPRLAVWVGPDERLSTAADMESGVVADTNQWDIYIPKDATRYFMISDVIRAQALRLDTTLPSEADKNRVYDNGEVQIYQTVPTTPFQR